MKWYFRLLIIGAITLIVGGLVMNKQGISIQDLLGIGLPSVTTQSGEIQGNQTVTRTPTTETICDNGKCVATSSLGFMNYWNGTEYVPINTTIVPSTSLWDYEVTRGVYQAYFKTDPTAGQVVKFEMNGNFTTFQPMALNYRNDLNQLQQIKMIDPVIGQPNQNEFVYSNAYGSGIDLRYRYENIVLKENLIINSSSDLISPEQFIINGGNPTLDLDFIIDFNGKMFIEGVEWNKATSKTTSNEVIIKDNLGNIIYKLHKPYAYDSNESSVELTYQFKKTGNSLFVVLKTPYSWLSNLSRVYPVFIDPTAGPNSPGTMATSNANGGTIDWTTPDNAKVSDDVYASAKCQAQTTYYLKATNFGFTIPAGATIDGIFVEIERKTSSTTQRVNNDVEVKIIKADGTIGTENKASGTSWSTTEAYYSYGNSTDLWSESWDNTKINDIDFGVVLSVYGAGEISGPTAYVDHIRITVYYTEAAADTCTYTSGNWDINCNDNCSISSPVNLNRNNVTIKGVAGSLNGFLNITNASVITGISNGGSCIIDK